MKNLKHIYYIIKEWKWTFIWSSIFLTIGIFFRMLEPKIFQVAIEYVAPMHSDLAMTDRAFDKVMNTCIAVIDFFNAKSFLSMLGVLAFLYFLVAIGRSGFVFSAKVMNASATEKAVKKLRNRFFKHIQLLPLSAFNKFNTGELIQRSTGDIETIRRFIGTQLIELIRLTAIFVFAAYWLFKGNVIFGLIAISAVPIIMISAYLFFKKEQKIWQKHEDEADKLNAIAQENIAGIRVVKAFAQEEEEKKKFDQQNQRKLKVAIDHAKLHTIFWPLSDFLVHFQIVAALIAGGFMVANQQITVGELVVYYSYIGMVAWPMRQVGRTLSDMGMALVAMDRIQQILNTTEEVYAKGKVLTEPYSTIEFKDVWFKYKEEDDFVLKGINFTIEAGKTSLLLGVTGAGKSTIIKLLTRLYDIQKGDILINGVSINELDKIDVRKRIGYALQEAFLFTETLNGNIAYANKSATEKDIQRVAQWSSLEEVDQIFPEGFKTMVGEKGVTLSGGQKQRVALSRTLLQNPDILVLDDVTSAVDTGTESFILQNLHDQWQNKTKIVISHRLTVVPFADQIIIIEDGKVAAKGTHEEILENNTFYQEIHALQNVLEDEIENI